MANSLTLKETQPYYIAKGYASNDFFKKLWIRIGHENVVSVHQTTKRASLRRCNFEASSSTTYNHTLGVVNFGPALQLLAPLLQRDVTSIYSLSAAFDSSGGVFPSLHSLAIFCVSLEVLYRFPTLGFVVLIVFHFFSAISPLYRDCGDCTYLPSYEEPPEALKELLETRGFMDNVRAYNQMFSMTSFGARIDETINDGRSLYVFKVLGQIYHWIGSLCPQAGTHPRFLQLYIYYTDTEVENRMAHFGGRDSNRICEDIVRKQIHLLNSHNELVRLFRMAIDKCNANEIPTFKIRLFNVTRSNQHSLPTSVAIGAIVFDTGLQAFSDYDVIIHPRSEYPRRFNKIHLSYMALQFPLMFFFGEPGFHPNLKLVDALGSTSGRPHVEAGATLSEYVVTEETERHQKRLPSGLYDAISRGDQTSSDVGSRTILPASFTDLPRYMYNHYLDALDICRAFGNPQFFVTFTYNVRWPEIARYLQPFPRLTTSDRVDIVARVFRFKVKEFVAFLKDERPLGDFRGAYFICYSKKLFAPCMEGPTCTKKFPKKYNDKTFFDADGRAHYRRRNTGVYTTRSGVHLDNSYVVPYNRLLCMTFQAHINVECCGSTTLIKYMFKYISKGTERIAARISKPVGSNSRTRPQASQPVDEVKNFIDSRFIFLHEA
ncbi:uncharacterized protein [Rutidosis leptorrhynchoides]|uniref:uncharacterized protein n=1 Tax=Rutidosis leptorrhynchoides TaxID=125765 RepID=UPI003A995A96